MVAALLDRLGVNPALYQQGNQPVYTPIDGSQIGAVHWEGAAETEQHVTRAEHAFEAWRKVPAPRRGFCPWPKNDRKLCVSERKLCGHQFCHFEPEKP